MGRDGEARSGKGNWRFGIKPGAAESEFAGNLEVKHIQVLCGAWERKGVIGSLRLPPGSPSQWLLEVSLAMSLSARTDRYGVGRDEDKLEPIGTPHSKIIFKTEWLLFHFFLLNLVQHHFLVNSNLEPHWEGDSGTCSWQYNNPTYSRQLWNHLVGINSYKRRKY